MKRYDQNKPLLNNNISNKNFKALLNLEDCETKTNSFHTLESWRPLAFIVAKIDTGKTNNLETFSKLQKESKLSFHYAYKYWLKCLSLLNMQTWIIFCYEWHDIHLQIQFSIVTIPISADSKAMSLFLPKLLMVTQTSCTIYNQTCIDLD